MAVTDWEPATEAETAMRDALRANDQELYFRILARYGPAPAGLRGRRWPGRRRWAGAPGPPAAGPTCWPSPRPPRCTPASAPPPVRAGACRYADLATELAQPRVVAGGQPRAADRGLPARLVRLPALPGRRPAARPRPGCAVPSWTADQPPGPHPGRGDVRRRSDRRPRPPAPPAWPRPDRPRQPPGPTRRWWHRPAGGRAADRRTGSSGRSPVARRRRCRAARIPVGRRPGIPRRRRSARPAQRRLAGGPPPSGPGRGTRGPANGRTSFFEPSAARGASRSPRAPTRAGERPTPPARRGRRPALPPATPGTPPIRRGRGHRGRSGSVRRAGDRPGRARRGDRRPTRPAGR